MVCLETNCLFTWRILEDKSLCLFIVDGRNPENFRLLLGPGAVWGPSGSNRKPRAFPTQQFFSVTCPMIRWFESDVSTTLRTEKIGVYHLPNLERAVQQRRFLSVLWWSDFAFNVHKGLTAFLLMFLDLILFSIALLCGNAATTLLRYMGR